MLRFAAPLPSSYLKIHSHVLSKVSIFTVCVCVCLCVCVCVCRCVATDGGGGDGSGGGGGGDAGSEVVLCLIGTYACANIQAVFAFCLTWRGGKKVKNLARWTYHTREKNQTRIGRNEVKHLNFRTERFLFIYLFIYLFIFVKLVHNHTQIWGKIVFNK